MAVLDSPTTVVVVNEEPFVFAEFVLTSGDNTLKQATNFNLDIDNVLKATAEKGSYSRSGLNELLDLAEAGLKQIFAAQRAVLGA